MENPDKIVLNATQDAVNYLSSRGVDTVIVGQQLSIFLFVNTLVSQIISIVHVSNDIGFHHLSDVVVNVFMTSFSVIGIFFTSIFTLMLYQAYGQAYKNPRMPFPYQFRVLLLICVPVFFIITMRHVFKTHIRTVDILDMLRMLFIVPTVYGAFCVHTPPTRRQKKEIFSMT